MQSDISSRFLDTLDEMSRRIPNDIVSADLDELKILHEYCQNEFSETFNTTAKSWQDPGDGRQRQEFLRRLVRILEVEASIPKELRTKKSLAACDTSELLPTFELGKKDKTRIFELCSKMRLIVMAATDFDEPHRLRLLNRIAAIEAETHKPKGLFDVVLGGVIDTGETLGKFGNEIKPLTDRMREVAGIARKGTKQYDQIPAPEEIEKLPKPEDFADE